MKTLGMEIEEKKGRHFRPLTRAEAVRLIEYQLNDTKDSEAKPNTYHYGRVELRALMDMIYGGPPQSEEEKIK